MNKENKKYNYRRHQQGLSLIELLISMVVGLFLLVGLVTSFISTKDTDRNRNAISEMDANANIIFDVMRKTVVHAGYGSIIPDRQALTGFYTERDGAIVTPICRNGSQRETATNRLGITETADNGNADSIAIISLADNPCLPGNLSCNNGVNVNPAALVYYDCTGSVAVPNTMRNANSVACSTDTDLGMTNRTDAKIYSSFSLFLDNDSDDGVDDRDRTFFCNGSRGGEQELAKNVEAVQYLYGVQEGNVIDNDVTFTFKTSSVVTADNDWEKVRSVQVALLMRSSDANIFKQDSQKTSYRLLNETVDIDLDDLKRLYRVYTTTINLENMN